MLQINLEFVNFTHYKNFWKANNKIIKAKDYLYDKGG